MHEFSISSEIVKTVLDTVKDQNGKKVLSVQVEIGELTHINKEQVAFWVKELFRETEAVEAEIKVKTTRARILCEDCGYKGGVKSEDKDPFLHLVPLACPKCQSSRVSVDKGKECILRKIQIEK
jgi:hydrogenase nickel incorporation protein HypA/HybF